MSYQRCSTRYAVTVSMPRSPTDTFKVIIDYWSASLGQQPASPPRDTSQFVHPCGPPDGGLRYLVGAPSRRERLQLRFPLEHCSGAIDHSVGRMRFRGFTAVVMGHTNHRACAPDQSRPDAL